MGKFDKMLREAQGASLAQQQPEQSQPEGGEHASGGWIGEQLANVEEMSDRIMHRGQDEPSPMHGTTGFVNAGAVGAAGAVHPSVEGVNGLEAQGVEVGGLGGNGSEIGGLEGGASMGAARPGAAGITAGLSVGSLDAPHADAQPGGVVSGLDIGALAENKQAEVKTISDKVRPELNHENEGESLSNDVTYDL